MFTENDKTILFLPVMLKHHHKCNRILNEEKVETCFYKLIIVNGEKWEI